MLSVLALAKDSRAVPLLKVLIANQAHAMRSPKQPFSASLSLKRPLSWALLLPFCYCFKRTVRMNHSTAPLQSLALHLLFAVPALSSAWFHLCRHVLPALPLHANHFLLHKLFVL